MFINNLHVFLVGAMQYGHSITCLWDLQKHCCHIFVTFAMVCFVLTLIIGLIHYSLESNNRPAPWCQKAYGETCCSSGYCMQFELPLDSASGL